jgi:hypothetical protein
VTIACLLVLEGFIKIDRAAQCDNKTPISRLHTIGGKRFMLSSGSCALQACDDDQRRGDASANETEEGTEVARDGLSPSRISPAIANAIPSFLSLCDS